MTAEVIEAEAVDVTEERQLQRVETPTRTQVILGGAGLALMSDADFERNLSALAVARTRAMRIQKALMVEGTDYGKVAGIDRPFLHKPGAETLDKAFGLAIRFEASRVIGDSATEPPIAFHVKGFAHLGDFEGPVVAQGYGEANAWEERYRYRKTERVCPKCGKPAVIKGSAQYGGGWLCWKKRDGCGSKWPDGAAEIESQETGKADNPDPWGLANTLLKMAVKRAHVDTTLRATGTSGLFTQDEDSPVVRPQNGASGASSDTEAPPPQEEHLEPQPSPLGPYEGTGKLGMGLSDSRDGQLRTTPDGGAFIGFVLLLPNGKKVSECVANDSLAYDIADACGGDLRSLQGAEVTVSGQLWAIPWKDKEGKSKPPYKRLVIERMVTAEWTLPAEVAYADDELNGRVPA